MRDISFQEALTVAVQTGLAGAYTALPCIVIGVHEGLSSQRVDVQPVINKRYKDETVERYPPILAVPVVFPASSTSAFTFPISVGDTVLCVFSQRGLDSFKSGDGSFSTPTDFRKMDKRDAIAIPGLFPFSKAINNPSRRSLNHDTKDAVLSHNIGTGNEVEIRLKSNGDLVINAPSKNVTVNSSSVTFNVPNTSWNGNISLNGNYTINGTLTLNGINMNTHRHTGVDTGNGTSGGPV